MNQNRTAFVQLCVRQTLPVGFCFLDHPKKEIHRHSKAFHHYFSTTRPRQLVTQVILVETVCSSQTVLRIESDPL